MKSRFVQLCLCLIIIFQFTSCHSNEVTNTDTSSTKTILVDKSKVELNNEDNLIKKFEWQSELCEYIGFYETNKFSEKQLKDTYFLVFEHNSVTALNTDVTLDKPEYYNTNYIENSLKKLENDYLLAANKLKSLDVVPSKVWLQHRELLLNELEELYKLEKLTLEAQRNPKLLKSTSYSDKCIDYVNALTSEDTITLLAEWKKLVEIKKSKNGFPEKLEEEYQRQLNSTNKLLFARIDLMAFGWWNCANGQRKYIDGFNHEGQITKEFNNLFSRIESACEE